MIEMLSEQVVVCDLVDLEHAGFTIEGFNTEAWMVGVANNEPVWPALLLVRYSGGSVMTPGLSKEEARAAWWASRALANKLIDKLQLNKFGLDKRPDDELQIEN